MDTSDLKGLSAATAAARLARDGPNALPEPERRSRLAIIMRVLREPMLLLLLAASGVYVLLGDATEAWLLAGSVVLVIGLTVRQETRAEHALRALRAMGAPRARVLRDGVVQVIEAREVVVGDVLLVSEGDRLSADARVIDAVDLHVDASLLTGEAAPVPCRAGAPVYAGSLAVRGHARVEVVATGTRTDMGRIGRSLHDIRADPTPLQHQMRRLVLLFAGLSLLSCIAMLVLYGRLRGDWLQALLAGLTLAIANIPEEFPVVVTVFLALGGWRMARQKALVRRASAIEAMGAITVLCTDKTGTLTENRMQVALLAPPHEAAGAVAHTPAQQALLRTAALACAPLSHDPMDRALQAASMAAGLVAPESQREREYPFSPALPLVAVAWRHADGVRAIACKGAPEAVATLCRLTPGEHDARQKVETLAARGLRVLAVAEALLSGPPGEVLYEHAFAWRGLVAFADPLRNGVADAVAEARAAGIHVVMLTGDHAATALAIAREAGIAHDEVPVSGAALETAPDAVVAELSAHTHVFARVRPQHKLRLIESLKSGGEIVAMTGDGVNDAPALAAAHVGIAMGGRGTDVAREAAAIVLLDDNFVSIVRAIRMGRAIYDNIQRAVRYILAVHVPITGMALLPLLTGGPLVLMPLHVVFLELIIDPACSIVLEQEPPAPGLMRRPPRCPREPLLTPARLLMSLVQGAGIFAVVALVHALAGRFGLPAAQAGGLAFVALVAGNLGLLLLYREGATLLAVLRQPNRAFWWVTAAALAVLTVVTRTPAAAAGFGFAPAPFVGWLLALAVPVATCMALKRLDQDGSTAFPMQPDGVDPGQYPEP